MIIFIINISEIVGNFDNQQISQNICQILV